MRRLRLFWACAFVPRIDAILVRADSPRNFTTTSGTEKPQISISSGVSWSTTIRSALTEFPNFKVHRESTATGFQENDPATIAGSPSQDIGSIIESFLTTAIRVGQPVSISIVQVANTPPHLEPTRGAFIEVTTPARQVPVDVRPVNTGIVDKSPPQITPPPAITRDGLTLRPVPVTSTSTLSKDGQAVATTQVVDFQYVVGSSTLSIGASVTVGGVRVALTTDASRSTVLIVGDTTTTLSAPVQALPATRAADASAPINISTTVVEGTTKYVIAGQTLAPGQPITVDNVPISIATSDGSTILVLGDTTTTFAGDPATQTVSGGSGSTTAMSRVTTGNENARSTSATKTGLASTLGATGTYFPAIAAIVAVLIHFG